MNQERREKAIAWIKEEIRSLERAPELNGCPMTPEWAAQLEIMRTCLEAVQDHFPDTTKMVPLTMEQLLGMDGQPVRVHNLRPSKKKFEWQNALVCKFRETAEHSFYTYWFRDYGKTWLAYAYHISHIDREAWVSVEERLPDDNERVIAYRPNEADVSAYKYCVMWGWSVKMSMKHRGISHWMPLQEPPAELEKRLRGVSNG